MPTKTTDRAKYEDTMRGEYDMRGGVRGKYAKRLPPESVTVILAPDVAAAFPDSDSVNDALRLLIKAARQAANAA